MDNKEPQALKRGINLPMLVLYGLGTTIGAGIYVLVGEAAGRAGYFAPLAFLLAAITIAPTAASYGELSGRYPVSSGEAAYVEGGFNSKWMSGFVGWLVIISGIVASATIAIGCAGYIRSFLDIPLFIAVIAVLAIVGSVAAWGIVESVIIAAIFTLIEVGGLLLLIGAGFISGHEMTEVKETVASSSFDVEILLGVASASLLAIFAFIGFEDMVNVAEETKAPGRTMPWAIFLTLIITSLLYAAVAYISTQAVNPSELAQSEAPLGLAFARLTNMTPTAISLIAIFATANTILVQIIMASRVIYGMSRQGTMPKILGRVNRITKTPLMATLAVIVATIILALGFELHQLADLTSLFVLFIWILANIALVLIKKRAEPAPSGILIVPIWVPIIGVLFSMGLTIIWLISNWG